MAKPLLFITGFLGAGKTTLLRGLLEELKQLDRSADVILNDYENAEIDAATLPDYTASIFPIAASCACCDSLQDLVKLCVAAQESRGDVLLIELNGTADPLPLLEAFTLLEEKMPFSPRWQVSVVDARHWGRRDEFAPLERRQFETATHWLDSHTESVSCAEIAQLKAAVNNVNPYATQVDAAGLAAKLISAIGGEESVTQERPEASSSPGAVSTTDHEHILSHRFTGCQIPMPGRYRREQIVRLLEELPGEVARAKALVKLKDHPGRRWLFERTGAHPVQTPQPVDGMPRTPASLVCIGPRLDPGKLRELVQKHFGT